MQSKTLTVAGLTGSFFVAGSVSAGETLMGIVAEFVDPVEEGWVDDGYDPDALDTYRIYAQFAGAGIDVVAVGDWAFDGITFSTTSTDGMFWNAMSGSDFPPNPNLIGDVPELQWDTFVTVGENPAQGSGGVPVTRGEFFFAEQAGGLTGDFTLDDTGWFAAGFPDFATPGEDGRVLIVQFTVAEGQHVEGLNWGVDGIADGEFFREFADFNTIPAPGALALIGLAGFATRRRRR